MLSIQERKQEIMDYATKLENLCNSNKDCKSCSLKNIEGGFSLFDFIGCPATNYLVERAEKYQKKTGNDAIESAVIGLTIYSKVKAIMNEDNMPDKKGILDNLNQLKITLSEVIEPEYEETEELLDQANPKVHKLPIKIATLF